jgi:hypothetical protein
VPGRVLADTSRWAVVSTKSPLRILDRRTPGISLRLTPRGVARVTYPPGVSFTDRPNPEVLRRIVDGLRRLGEASEL